MYAAIRSGRVRQTMGILKEREGKTAGKLASMFWNAQRKEWTGVRRHEVRAGFMIPETARGLGAIEGNEAN